MAGEAVARETLFALRQTIAHIEGRTVVDLDAAREETEAPGLAVRTSGRGGMRILPFGLQAMDEPMEGGLPLDAVTEIRSDRLGDAGAASGFMLALSARLLMHSSSGAGPARILWIGDETVAREAGLPHAAGLRDYGLDPRHLLYARPKRIEDGLWLAEAGLASGIFCAVILEVCGNPRRFGLTESRRLSLKARSAGRPLLLLRQGGEEEAGSAVFRVRIRPSLAQSRRLPDGSVLGGSIATPIFRVTLEKSRLPAPVDIHLEWNPYDRLFSLTTLLPVSADNKQTNSGAVLSPSADGQDRTSLLGGVVAFDRAS
ncbi:MAG TPA: hypothetical protein VK181_06950 [Rhizobium sp.]|nr:hypothetical protein [Rhizobium sp.]